MSIPEQAGKVATATVEAMKNQPGLIFLTLVNMAFLVFTYFLATLVLDAYEKQQEQMHQRYTAAIGVIDRCINEAFDFRDQYGPQRSTPTGPRL